MAEKGKKVGEVSSVLRWTDSHGHNVQVNISVDGAGVECGEEYIAVIELYQGPDGMESVAEFEVTIHSNDKRITLPKDVIQSSDALVPGRSIKISFYGVIEDKDITSQDQSQENYGISDSAEVLGRATPNKDPSSSDGLDSTLYHSAVGQYLEQNGESMLKFRNIASGKETLGTSYAGYVDKESRFSFPKTVRDEIDVSEGDLIEIIKPAQADSDDEDKIDEIHRMVSEMYEAYLEVND